MIRRKDLGYFIGKMDEFLSGIGIKENSMALEHTFHFLNQIKKLKGNQEEEWDYGKMEKE